MRLARRAQQGGPGQRWPKGLGQHAAGWFLRRQGRTQPCWCLTCWRPASRYHSLAVEEASLPACLEPLAWTTGEHHALALAGDGSSAGGKGSFNGEGGGAAGAGSRVLMALAHRSLPHWGVQFHPESVATRYGAALLQNFRDLTCAHHGLPRPPPHPCPAGPPGRAMPPRPWEAAGGRLALVHEALPSALEAAGGSEALFLHLFARGARREQDAGAALEGSGRDDGGSGSSLTAEEAEDTFWLDSATATDRGRFSFMGGRGGPLWRRVHYHLPSLEERKAHSTATEGEAALPPGTLVETDALGRRAARRTALLPWLRALLARLRCRIDPALAAALPFDFWGGLVGYWGYELKAECGGAAAHASPLPDAAFFVADRLLALDHLTGAVHVLALYEAGGGNGGGNGAAAAEAEAEAEAEAQAWVAATVAEVRRLCKQQRQSVQQQQHQQQQQQQQPEAAQGQRQPAPPPFRLREGRAQYLANVGACMASLHAGESYELCLTTELRRCGAPDALALYRTLRAVNPAPYAAWLHLGPGAPRLACSSPERFLRGGRGGVLEARPIKGTAPRVRSDAVADVAAAAALAASEKDRAENLMIVDLLR